MPSRNLTIILVAAVVSTLCFKEAQRSRYAHTLSDVIDTISLHYVKDVDKRKLFEDGVTGMVDKLDPYSGYFSPSDLREFNKEMRQEFGGIGIEVGMRDEKLTVISPLPGTPAFKAGLLAGDVIVAVDGQQANSTQLSELVKLIQGKPGTAVKLTILHAGATEPVELGIVRAIIEVDSIRGDLRNKKGDWIYTLEDHPRIGFLRLTKFAQKTTDELKRTIETIQGDLDGLIIDLRGNPGGLLDAAVEICDLFTEKGQEIVSIKRRRGVLQQRFDAENPPTLDPDLPLAILVNGFSASASEILAACLQDHERAAVIGQRTFGKGTVQNVIKIESGRSALRLTTATYWRPSGKNIHRHQDDKDSAEWGVTPEPEFNIEITDEEFQKILKYRYDRDVQKAVKGAEGIAPVTEPVADPHLDKAIEYIQKMNARESLPAQAA